MHTTQSAGGVVIGPRGTIALVRNRGGNGAWLFPKGHVDEGETDEEAARREVQEETGLTDLEFIDDLGTYSRFAIRADGSEDTSHLKEIHMFLFAAQNFNLAPTMEIEEARWVSFSNAIEEIGSAADKAWFVSQFERVRHAIQRD